MGNLFRFIFSKAFVINVVIAIIIVVAGIFLFMNFLENYTRHNETVEVPDFDGFHYSELENFVGDKDVYFEIIDSVYDAELPRGVVIEQHPEPNSYVKPGRKIYLTINSVRPPMVSMPELRDMTLRSALNRIESYGLKTGKIIPTPSECKNCIVDLLINGKSVPAGTKLKEGQTIDLVVGAGMSNELIQIPVLYELTLLQADSVLRTKGLNKGIVQFDSTITSQEDSVNAFIFKQFPDYIEGGEIHLGSSIDLLLTLDSNKIPEFQLPTTEPSDSSLLIINDID